MEVHERERHLLYEKAVEVLGEAEAEILMKHLPPGGHEDLATKADLEQGLEGVRLELRAELAALRGELHSALRSQLVMFVGVMSLMNAGMFAAFRLTL